MLSDKFHNLTDTGRVRKVIHTAPDGHQTTVPKEWAEYTIEEKAQRISYHQGCGIGVAMFLLEMEQRIEQQESRIKDLEDRVATLNRLVP